MKKIFYATLSAFALLIGNNLFGQVSITGPTCVVPGVTYTYNISATWDSLSVMKVCVTGGTIADSTNVTTCTTQGPPLNAVTIKWTASSEGLLVLSSSIGNSNLAVNITTALSGGSIDSTVSSQMIATDSIPAVINCSAATGGACSPTYSYQWEQSLDIVSWIDIPGATGQNLAIDSGLTQSKFYRRKVIEGSSGSVAYSTVAAIFVGVSGFQNKAEYEQLYCLINNEAENHKLIR